MQFEDIYRLEVITALENDHELDFKDIRSGKYLQKGICPSCAERTLYIARDKPYQLKCNRLNQCQHEEKTRERYSYQGNESAMVAAMPGIRPGATFNQAQRIVSVSLAANQMGLKWKKQ